jgi:hypothetical protein
VNKLLRLGAGTVVGEFVLVGILMLLYGHVFDAAMAEFDFSVFSKKPCQVKSLEKLKYLHPQRGLGCHHPRLCSTYPVIWRGYYIFFKFIERFKHLIVSG